MIPCYLINLDRSADRLAFANQRLQDLCIQYIRVVATDGSLMPEEERRAFIKMRPRNGGGWLPGQIGCFMSHMAAWRKIAEGSAPFGLVLEDDVHLSDEIAKFLSDPSWIPSDADIVRLETTGQWLLLDKATHRAGNRSVRRVRSAAWAAGAYILTQAAAVKLLAVDPVLHAPVDYFLFSPGNSATARSLIIYQMSPALAEQDKFKRDQSASNNFGSGIEFGKINKSLQGLSAVRRAITSTLRGKSNVKFS